MKRPQIWLRWVLAVCVLMVIAEYVTLTWVAPRYVLRLLQRMVGAELAIDEVKLSLPLTTMFSGIRFVNNSTEAAVSIERATVRMSRFSIPSRTLWVDAVELERPLIRVTRAADQTMRWPSLPALNGAKERVESLSGSSAVDSMLQAPWHVHVQSVKVVDATVEFIDEKPSPSFHGLLDHVSIVLGPVTLPWQGAPISFAVQGEALGAVGHTAPARCSGWVDWATKDLQASCQLDPLPLAAFEPYLHGPPEIRVYSTTLTSTSRWSARANELTGRLQLELGSLTEGDLSIHGRTLVDVKKFMGGQETRLTGEVTLTGPLDDPHKWHAGFLPGDAMVQQLVSRLLDRGVEVVRISLAGTRLPVSLSPSNQATMTDIEAASKEVQEALEILALPTIAEVVPEAATPSPEAPGAPATTPEAAASGEAAPPASSEAVGASPSIGTTQPETALAVNGTAAPSLQLLPEPSVSQPTPAAAQPVQPSQSTGPASPSR